MTMAASEFIRDSVEFAVLADDLLAAGRARAGGEMLFGALSQVIIALAIGRQAPFREHQHRRRVIRELAAELADPDLTTDFGVAQRLHVHFYLNDMDAADFAASIATTKALLARLTALAAGGAGDALI